MPRDPDRIPLVLAALERYWTKHPDLRLGQIVSNVSGKYDPFYLDDTDLLTALEKAEK